jgi:hypothetical protein
MLRISTIARVAVCCGTFALLLALPRGARAGEITLFWSRNAPRDSWRAGQGATLTMGILKVVQIEAEGARGLDSEDLLRMTYFTGSAAVKMPFSKVSPFAGLGVGLYQQSLGSNWKINTLQAAFVGVKVRLADLVVLRGEYRRFSLNGTPYAVGQRERRLESRISLGVGIAF